jgi:hydroxymethylpyrimidine/phosphomethylpyrimidine kinase
MQETFQRNGSVLYFEVDDVDATVRRLSKDGIVFATEPADQTWLWREARLYDPAGNQLCIFHGGANRRYPPWRLNPV